MLKKLWEKLKKAFSTEEMPEPRRTIVTYQSRVVSFSNVSVDDEAQRLDREMRLRKSADFAAKVREEIAMNDTSSTKTYSKEESPKNLFQQWKKQNEEISDYFNKRNSLAAM
jgi:uncharacterized membrane protein YgcG